MSSSLFFLGLFALLQVATCRPPSDEPSGGLAQDIDLQSFLTNMLMKANLQEGLDYEDEDEKRRMEIENIDYPQEQDATNDDGDTEDLPLGDTDDDRYLAIQGEVLEDINSGDTVSFKTGLPFKWMTFWKSIHPFTSKCPSMFMDNRDYSSCQGTVFNLYRLNFKGQSQGTVRVGEMVGIYYPRDKFWLGCAGGTGAKCYRTTCPGKPTLANGFANTKLIKQCYGAVFKIFARGKKIGDVITHRDDILLYINSGGQYVSYRPKSLMMYGSIFEAMIMHRGICPGRAIPPSKYEQCPDEIFSIWKKGLN